MSTHAKSLTLLALCLFGVTGTASAQTTRDVCPGGSCTYTTIQAAVDASGPGDAVVVGAGVYDEAVTIPAGKDGLEVRGVQAGADAAWAGRAGTETQVVRPGGIAFTVASNRVKLDGLSITSSAIGVMKDSNTSGLQVVSSY